MASIVMTFLRAAAETGVEQERTGLPSRCTVQAPQSATPQPNLVPVMPRVSRSTHRSGVSGLSPTEIFLPFTLREIIDSLLVILDRLLSCCFPKVQLEAGES